MSYERSSQGTAGCWVSPGNRTQDIQGQPPSWKQFNIRHQMHFLIVKGTPVELKVLSTLWFQVKRGTSVYDSLIFTGSFHVTPVYSQHKNSTVLSCSQPLAPDKLMNIELNMPQFLDKISLWLIRWYGVSIYWMIQCFFRSVITQWHCKTVGSCNCIHTVHIVCVMC